MNTLAYFGDSNPPSSCKEKRGKNDKSRSLVENLKATLDHEKSEAKKLPRIQDEKDDAININVPVFNMPQSLFEHSQSAFMWEVIGFNPPNPSLYPTIYPQILYLIYPTPKINFLPNNPLSMSSSVTSHTENLVTHLSLDVLI